jgi:hypothetical protein
MTLEHGAAVADVKIRVPRHVWMLPFVIGAGWLMLGALNVWRQGPLYAPFWMMTFSCISVAVGLWSRTRGVDLTRESANLRGVHRRSVPWQEVQAVVRHGSGSMGVRLILEHGKRVGLRAPRTDGILGVAQFDRDFQCIEQWWRAHRGEHWRPEKAETPPPVQR